MNCGKWSKKDKSINQPMLVTYSFVLFSIWSHVKFNKYKHCRHYYLNDIIEWQLKKANMYIVQLYINDDLIF